MRGRGKPLVCCLLTGPCLRDAAGEEQSGTDVRAGVRSSGTGVCAGVGGRACYLTSAASTLVRVCTLSTVLGMSAYFMLLGRVSGNNYFRS